MTSEPVRPAGHEQKRAIDPLSDAAREYAARPWTFVDPRDDVRMAFKAGAHWRAEQPAERPAVEEGPRDEDDDVQAAWDNYNDKVVDWADLNRPAAVRDFDALVDARKRVEAAIERRRGVAAPQASEHEHVWEWARIKGESCKCGTVRFETAFVVDEPPAVQAGGGDEAWGALDVAFQEWEVNREGPWTWQDVRDITRRVRSEREQAGGLRAALDEADSFITSLYYRHRSSIPESELAEAERLVRLLTSLRAPARG